MSWSFSMSPETKLAAGKLLLDHPAEAVARLTISNPEKRNALDHEILDAIAEVLPSLDSGIEVRCVLITGAGERAAQRLERRPDPVGLVARRDDDEDLRGVRHRP